MCFAKSIHGFSCLRPDHKGGHAFRCATCHRIAAANGVNPIAWDDWRALPDEGLIVVHARHVLPGGFSAPLCRGVYLDRPYRGA